MSSPRHTITTWPNAEVEAGVNVATSLLTIALKDNNDHWLVLPDQRNTWAQVLYRDLYDFQLLKNSTPNCHSSPVFESVRKCGSASQAKKTKSTGHRDRTGNKGCAFTEGHMEDGYLH